MKNKRSIDCVVKNFAPNADTIRVDINDWTISIGRDIDQKVRVSITDNQEGSEIKMILGEAGETQKL